MKTIDLFLFFSSTLFFRSPSITKDSWLQALKKCISESDYVPKEMSSASFDGDVKGYDDLDFSKKLRLLTFLCDEALGTM